MCTITYRGEYVIIITILELRGGTDMFKDEFMNVCNGAKGKLNLLNHNPCLLYTSKTQSEVEVKGQRRSGRGQYLCGD